MILDQDKIDRIRNELKFHPKGMSITELAHQLKINRNSVAKYLEILLISGQVESHPYGTSKVYMLSRRIPVSAMMSFSSDMILMIQADGTILQCNESFLKFSGLSYEKVIGQPFSEIEPTVFPDISFKNMFREETEKSTKSFERVMCRDGREYTLSIRIIPTRFDNGNKGFTLILEDISDKVQAERTLAEREKLYRGILESIQDVYYRSDLDGNLIMASPSWASLLGYATLDECLSRNIAADFYIEPEKRKEFLRELEEKGFVFDYEVVLKKKDGSPLPVATNSHFYYDEKGAVLGVEGIFRDISERKAAAEKVNQSIRRVGFLSRKLLDFIRMDTSENIYQQIAADLQGLVPGAIILVNSFNEATGIVRVESVVAEEGELAAIQECLGHGLSGMELPIDAIGLSSFRTGSLCRTTLSLYEIAFKAIPKPVCQDLEKRLAYGEVYAIGFLRGTDVLGNAAFFLRKGTSVPDSVLLAMYIRQASIALQRFSADEAHRRSEDLFMNLTQASPLPIAIIEPDGTYRFINRSFRTMFGYDLADFHDSREWLRLAFPEPEYRRNVIAAWKQDFDHTPVAEPRIRTFTVQCKDMTRKEIVFRAVTLADGNQCILFEDVTERREADRTRRLLSSIIESTGDAVIGKDIAGVVVSWNRAAEHLYGFTRDEMIGRHISLIIPPERRKEIEEISERIGHGESVRNLKTQRIRKDGAILDVWVTVSPITDENGIVTGASTIAREIPPEPEFPCGFSGNMVADIIECTPDAAFVIDNAKHVVAWNTAMEHLYDLPREKMLMRDDYARWMSHVTPPYPQLIDLLDAPDSFVMQYYGEVTREGTTLTARLHLSLDGSGMDDGSSFEIRASPITDARGDRIGAIQATRRVTFSKREPLPSGQHSEDAAALAEKPAGVSGIASPGLTSLISISNALRRMREGILILDLSARCIWVNDAMTGLLGVSGDDAVVGKSFAQFVTKEHRKAVLDQLSSVYRDGSGLFPFTLLHPDCPVPVEASVTTIADIPGSPLGYLAILRKQ